jgi:RNA polymerase sigma-70 factor (ECF subfamily)
MTPIRPKLTEHDPHDEAHVTALLAQARAGDRGRLGALLELYRNYLAILAAAQFSRKLLRRLSPSDLVQETMLAAHRDFEQFRGASEPEFLAWLRQILINCLRRAIDVHVKAKKRDVRCEISIEHMSAAWEGSTAGVAEVLADPGPSPSATAHQRERAVVLANQLAGLKPEYRDVLVLRNLQGLSFDEIAQRLQRKPGTVRMLWLRAIEKLRTVSEPID